MVPVSGWQWYVWLLWLVQCLTSHSELVDDVLEELLPGVVMQGPRTRYTSVSSDNRFILHDNMTTLTSKQVMRVDGEKLVSERVCDISRLPV